jgi:hypothetical protein
MSNVATSAEMCYCPRSDIEGFESDWGCSASDPAGQIDADLKRMSHLFFDIVQCTIILTILNGF